MDTASFYRAFEERYYSPRRVIRRMRAQYLPFVQPLAPIYPGAPTFDIGCGRGEWLEHMQELGFQSLGMDLDDGMLQDCRLHGLPARQGDAVANLASLPDASQAVISAFHVVEHLSFEQLWTILTQAQRALLPGGLLIMETPNPDNLRVATHNFYLDPTHRQPLPAMLLSFLAEYHGFARVLVRPLQESPELRAKADPTLVEVITGASPDYAVIAQKTAVAAVLEPFDAAFATQGGLELQELATRYDAAIEQRLQSTTQTQGAHLKATLEQRIQDINQTLSTHFEATLEQRIQDINQTLSTHFEATLEQRIQDINQALSTHFEATLEQRIQDINQALSTYFNATLEKQAQEHHEFQAQYHQQVAQCHQQADQHRQLIDHLATERAQLLASASWRITAPVRAFYRLLLRLAGGLQWLLASAIKTTFAMPAVRATVAERLQRHFPAGYDWLIHFAQRRGLLPGLPPSALPGESSAGTTTATPDLTPSAQRLRADLQRAARQRQETP